MTPLADAVLSLIAAGCVCRAVYLVNPRLGLVKTVLIAVLLLTAMWATALSTPRGLP